jgi:peptidoglycan/xylan/chitin deacetylase (PgdA/CDA1 family)
VRLGKHGTWLACGIVAAAIAGAGSAVAAALDSWIPAAVGGVLAATYLAGTFSHSLPLFGRPARARREPGRFALTFDDGPDPRHTPAIGSALAERGHQATFFVLATHARRHPDVLAGLVESGHELASHGDDHRLLALSAPATLRAQLESTEAAVEAATGRAPAPLFRPPHGVRSPWLHRTVARRGYRVCGWSGSVFDTAGPGVDALVSRVARLLRPGAVVLLHDGDGSGRGASRRQTVDALPRILDEAERRGLHSVRLSTLLD